MRETLSRCRREALRLNPQYTDARILRGHAQMELGDLDQALSELNDVLRQFPDKEQSINRAV